MTKQHTLYISTRDTNGMANDFEAWINTNHPDITTEVEIDGNQTISMDDNGNVIEQDFWEDFCNS